MTDNREIGREMAADRDFILVNAANRGVDCREQLEAAERNLTTAVVRCARIAHERALIEQGRGMKSWRGAFQAARDICVLNGLDPDIIDGFNDEQQVSIRALFSEKQQDDAAKALAPIEQPQSAPAPRQILPGEDSDETCLCSACVVLRGMKDHP